MSKATNFNEKNREFRRRWLELQERDPESRAVKTAKERLGDELIKANSGMIGAEIHKYVTHSPELEHDLFDTAAAELWKIFQRWDPERGTLRTAAITYIRGAVRREMVRHDHPDMTYDDYTIRNRAVIAKRDFELQHGRVPTTSELSREAEISEAKLAHLFSGSPVSLDAPVGGSDTEDLTLESVVAEREDPNGAGTAEELAEMNSQLEDDAISSSDPTNLLAYLMKQGSSSGPGARGSELQYMLGYESERAASKEVGQFTLLNAYIKLRRMLGSTPTVEQLSILAGTKPAATERFMEEMDVLEAQRVLRDLHGSNPSATLLAEATGLPEARVRSVMKDG